jgi:hypothetical protein
LKIRRFSMKSCFNFSEKRFVLREACLKLPPKSSSRSFPHPRDRPEKAFSSRFPFFIRLSGRVYCVGSLFPRIKSQSRLSPQDNQSIQEWTILFWFVDRRRRMSSVWNAGCGRRSKLIFITWFYCLSLVNQLHMQMKITFRFKGGQTCRVAQRSPTNPTKTTKKLFKAPLLQHCYQG